MKSRVLVLAAAAAIGVPLLAMGCSSGSDEPYKPQPAWSGRKPNLPAVPQLPTAPIKAAGDAYTVYGAIHQLRSRFHSTEVTAKDIAITGYIIQSNIPDAPACAVHKTGKKDPDDCINVPIPSFWIADSKDTKVSTTPNNDPKAQTIRVLGWAKNFASVFEAMQKYRGKDCPKELYKDEVWTVDVPCPLPAVGAKVTVTGHFGFTFNKATTGIVSDPEHGVLTYTKMDVLEPAPEPAAFAKK